MKHKEKNKLLRSITERRKAVFKAIDIELGNSLEKWTNRSRTKRHIISTLYAYFEEKISYLLELEILWIDDKNRLRWTKIGRSIKKMVLRTITFLAKTMEALFLQCPWFTSFSGLGSNSPQKPQGLILRI